VAVSNRDPDLGKALTSSQEAMGGMSGETSENVPANLKAANLSDLGLKLRFGKVGADEVEDFLANDAFEGSITDDE
jgi:hypothetical protein